MEYMNKGDDHLAVSILQHQLFNTLLDGSVEIVAISSKEDGYCPEPTLQKLDS